MRELIFSGIWFWLGRVDEVDEVGKLWLFEV